jgi:hypothetical protein
MNQEEPLSNPNVILNALKNSFLVHDIQIDLQDFKKFCESVNYPTQYNNLFGSFLKEKLVEHYLSTRLLNFSTNDCFIDIAASYSHYSEFIQKMGIESYKQDLIYPNGITVAGDSPVPQVGGSAARLPFRDNYFTKMTLHCSIEHFENNDDVGFIKESERVMKTQGRICILPLYLGETYHLVTDQVVYDNEKTSIQFEEQVPIYFKNGYGNRHCRVYSVDRFKKRITASDCWRVDIYHVTNLPDIGLGLYCEYAALLTKK